MDAGTDATYPAADAGTSELTPVAVTRWTARLVDPEAEREFLLSRFADDRRRLILLMGFVAFASLLVFLVEHFTTGHGGSGAAPLIPALAAILMPVLGLAITLRTRSPRTLEVLMLTMIPFGTVMRLSILTSRPDMADMWVTMMVGILFVIYLYMPIRLVGSILLAVAFSFVAPLWWWLTQGDVLPAQVFYRGLVWLLLANALGFTAANSLQRSQRMQFAQRLLLNKLLSTDAMTGIANRRRFDDTLAREWRRCQRAGAPLSLLMIDVDHFKAYNDHCGHPQGDACLRQVARLLVDTVGRPGDLVARYGGEEFACLLPEVGAAGALDVANKLIAALKNADIDHPRSPAGPRLTISVGVATMKKPSGSPESLVVFADKMLYAAKAAGRNQVRVGQLGAVAATARAA